MQCDFLKTEAELHSMRPTVPARHTFHTTVYNQRCDNLKFNIIHFCFIFMKSTSYIGPILSKIKLACKSFRVEAH
jgi:hypothetical protein